MTLIKELWTGERVTFDGTYYQTEHATIYDRPDQPVPIYIGASGPAATRFAGRVADGFITTSGKDRELYTETLLPAVGEGAAKADRTLDDLDLMIEVKVSFDPDLARAREDTRFWGALALSPDEKTGVEDPIEMERLVRRAPRRAGPDGSASDPDEHAEVGAYVDMGFRHLVFHAPGPDQRRFLDSTAKRCFRVCGTGPDRPPRASANGAAPAPSRAAMAAPISPGVRPPAGTAMTSSPTARLPLRIISQARVTTPPVMPGSGSHRSTSSTTVGSRPSRSSDCGGACERQAASPGQGRSPLRACRNERDTGGPGFIIRLTG